MQIDNLSNTFWIDKGFFLKFILKKGFFQLYVYTSYHEKKSELSWVLKLKMGKCNCLFISPVTFKLGVKNTKTSLNMLSLIGVQHAV